MRALLLALLIVFAFVPIQAVILVAPNIGTVPRCFYWLLRVGLHASRLRV
jgi:hypothetical protein